MRTAQSENAQGALLAPVSIPAPVSDSRTPTSIETSRPRGRVTARRFLLAVLAVAIIGITAYLLLRPTSADVFNVGRHDITVSAHGVGTVEAKNVVDLSSKVTGRLLTVYVDDGDSVSRGQVLATVDDAELRAALDSSRAALARAQLAVTAQEASTARARSTLAAGVSSAAKARAELALSRKNAERWRRLYEQGVVAESERDARETEATVNSAALAAADAETTALRREVDAQVAALDMARQDVLAARAADDAALGTPILRVADPASAWVTIYLNEAEAGSVKAGDASEIVLRSSPESPVRGTVARVRRESDRVTEQLAVDIKFDTPSQRLVLGEQAEATISGATMLDVVAVPLSAVARSESGAIVLVVSEGRLSATPVRLGLAGSDGLVEVMSGLEEGQTVVALPARFAEVGNEGRRIRPVLIVPASSRGVTP
jgi:HlyD family secretion protein